ncbi:hypothetical protein CRE_10927 [Caenorhabditis remanei]|uniref:Uncharacterized protein n=1 Tax=Caenorhabditis remanei TaxID=31234 RepID=E3M5J9_CAERE|nr:hypothetical protein CRE_10927 [Caenorhabditis remanei]
MTGLHLHVNEIPSPLPILLFGLQQMMICLSALLVVPYIVFDMLCAGEKALEIRVQLISATFVTSGIATILQTTFGMRLSILHGPSFAFIPALHTFQAEFPCNSDTSTNNWEEKMQMVPDSFLFILRLNDYQISGSCSRFHWSYRKDFEIYRTSYNSSNYEFIDNWHRARYRKENGIALDLYCRFQYLLGIIIAWIICLILTVTNWEPPGGEARTDKNVSLAVFEETPWVQIPKPLFFGAPKFNAALICGFMASCFAAMIESIGDYSKHIMMIF